MGKGNHSDELLRKELFVGASLILPIMPKTFSVHCTTATFGRQSCSHDHLIFKQNPQMLL